MDGSLTISTHQQHQHFN